MRPAAYISYVPDLGVPSAPEAGEPEELVKLLAYLFTEVMDGRNASLPDGVQRALGREPRDFADYARRTAVTGVWAAELANHR